MSTEVYQILPPSVPMAAPGHQVLALLLEQSTLEMETLYFSIPEAALRKQDPLLEELSIP